MSSLSRIESSRANGARSHGPITEEGKLASAANSALSTGPVTPEGKASSSQNALRHGMLAGAIVLGAESPRYFSEVLATLQAEFQPAPGVESHCVEVMAVAKWRLERLWSLEGAQYEMETRKQALTNAGRNPTELTAIAFRALSDESRALELINRYESRNDRQYQRALNTLNARRQVRNSEISKRSEPSSSEPGIG
jgi:hypothetical protein